MHGACTGSQAPSRSGPRRARARPRAATGGSPRAGRTCGRRGSSPGGPGRRGPEPELAQDQLAREVGGDEVGVAVHDEDAELGIEREHPAERAHRLGLPAAGVPVPGAADPAVQHQVAAVRQPAQRVAVVGDRRAGQRRGHRVEHRVGGAPARAFRRRVGARHGCVVDADPPAVVAQSLAHEGAGVDPAGGARDRLPVDAGQRADPIDQPADGRLVLEAEQQVGDEVAGGVGLGGLERRLREGAALLHRRGGRGGQERHLGQRRVVGLLPPAEVEHRREQRHAVERDSEVGLQRLGDQRPAEPAIALADEVLRRPEPPALRQPAQDEVGERLDVAVDRQVAVPQPVVRLDQPAEPGADRVDEDEVGEIEPGARGSARDRPAATARSVAASIGRSQGPSTPNCR